MKNPQNGEWYLLAYNGDTMFITVTRSKGGVVRAWHGYSDKTLATAGGYGYDKESQVLAIACGDYLKQHDASDDDVQRVYNTGAAGITSTARVIEDIGGKLYDRHDAIGLIHDDIQRRDDCARGVYPVCADKLRRVPEKARAVVYGNVTNEAVAMANFINSRMSSIRTELVEKLKKL